MIAFAIEAWETPPPYLAKWRRGAAGERKTARALAELEEGWQSVHDVERSRGNIDHLVEGPGGIFLIETKTLGGTVRIEGGVLHTVQLDDPEEVYRADRLRERVLARAAEEADRRRDAGGGRRPWVQAVVVIWGDFPQQRVEEKRLVYLHGSQLVPWLRARVSGRVVAQNPPEHDQHNQQAHLSRGPTSPPRS